MLHFYSVPSKPPIPPVTKKLGVPTKQPNLLICYDFHLGIFNEQKDLMFAIEIGLFSIGTIDVPT
jgi:hypothetical protein